MSDSAHDMGDQTAPAAAATLIWLLLAMMSRGGATMARQAGSTRLTPRETEVLRLVTLGWTNAEIAVYLRLSRRTVDQHLTSIYNRLGVSCRAAATRLAMLNSLC